MFVQGHNGKYLTIKNGEICGDSNEFSNIGFILYGEYAIIYDKENGKKIKFFENRVDYGIPIKIKHLDGNNYCLIDFYSGKYISFIDVEEKSKLELREIKNEWEVFIINKYDNKLKNYYGKSYEDILLIDEDFKERRAIFSALTYLLPVDNFLSICSKIIKDYNIYLSIINLFDFYESDHTDIKKMYEWFFGGRKKSYYENISNKYDNLYLTSKGYGLLHIEEKIIHAIRRSINPIDKVCVVTTARNEGIYILEWIAHYKNLGVDHIYIYSNNNSDSSDLLLRSLSDRNIITYIENDMASGEDAQSKSYSHALMVNNSILNYEWSIFVDMDEFLCVNKNIFYNIKEFLLWHENKEVDIISINWSFVASGGNKRWKESPIYSRFKGENIVDIHVKCINRTNKFIGSRPHHPYWDDQYDVFFRDSSREEHLCFSGPVSGEKSFSDNKKTNYAIIYHFFEKSVEEFIWKFSRNRGDYPAVLGENHLDIPEGILRNFIENFNKKIEHTSSMIDDYVLENNNLIENYLKDDKIKNMHNLVIDSYRKKIETVFFRLSELSLENDLYKKLFFLLNS